MAWTASSERIERIHDEWSLEMIRESAMRAYKHLDDAGEIRIVDICYKRMSGTIMISYDSQLPEEWMHERLREVEKGIAEK